MANYRISYVDDAAVTRTIDLLPGDDGVRVEWQTEINRNISSTGIYENVAQNVLRFVTFDCYFQETAFHKLESFMAFSMIGKPFSFTKDSTRTPSQPLTAANPGNSSILTLGAGNTGDFIAEDPIVIHDDFFTRWEVDEISLVNPTTLQVQESTKFSYSVGDMVEWYYYFSSLLLLDTKFDPNRDGSFWHHKFNCVEVRNVT